MTGVHRRHRHGLARRSASGHPRHRLSDRAWLLVGAVVFLAEIAVVVAVFAAVM